jgi:tetratricopeptide (TPR) repeat protein
MSVELDTTFAPAFGYRGYLYLDRNDYGKAQRDLDTAIQLEPQVIYYLNRALAFEGQGQYKNALADLDEAIRLDPRSALAFYARGLFFENHDQRAGAIEDLREAQRLSELPGSPMPELAALALAQLQALGAR